MSEQDRLLADIESQWPRQLRRGLSELIKRHPDEQFYAGAFWLFYCDHTVIHPPTFGVNAESMLEGEVAGAEQSWRYQPAEWHWSVLKSVGDAMMPLYLRLSEAMRGESEAAWRAVIDANEQLIGRVAQQVTTAIRHRTGEFQRLALPETFVVFAVDVREDAAQYNRLLRLSVNAGILATLPGILVPEDTA